MKNVLCERFCRQGYTRFILITPLLADPIIAEWIFGH